MSQPPDDTPTDAPALPLQQDALLRLIYDDPTSPHYDPPPASPLPPDLTRPAFGQARQHNAAPLQERENDSYEWTRSNYHNFVEKIGAIEASRADGLESNLNSQDLRDYVLKQLIGLSGHPDPKVATKALDMLAKSKYVGLYEEKRAKAADEMSPAELDAAIKLLLNR